MARSPTISLRDMFVVKGQYGIVQVPITPVSSTSCPDIFICMPSMQNSV